MKNVLFIILISCFSLFIIISCTSTDNSDKTAPTVSSTYPSDNQIGVTVSDNISVTFSKAMDTTSVSTHTSQNDWSISCSGSFQVSSDNFNSCVQMNVPGAVTNSYQTFTVTPSSNLSISTNYKIRVTSGVKDSSGKTMNSQYEMTNGFTTETAPSYVAVGRNGTILTSTNGITWTSRTSGTTNSLFGVTYGKGLFLAVGVSGTILTSSDGITWTSRTSGTSDLLEGITYGNSTFVTVGIYGTLLTSSDGISWTSRTSGTINDLYGVTYKE